LIENNFRGDRWAFAIVGIGININQTTFPENARHPVSLRQITGQTFDAVALARELGERLDQRYCELEAGAPLLARYNERLYRLGQQARLRKDNVTFETTITGVSPQGQLRTKDGVDREFSFGEVEWVI
jgi:BirA family biotin operon repressor/biotin-[acetyl-CoA-carboxylase] ligase